MAHNYRLQYNIAMDILYTTLDHKINRLHHIRDKIIDTIETQYPKVEIESEIFDSIDHLIKILNDESLYYTKVWFTSKQIWDQANYRINKEVFSTTRQLCKDTDNSWYTFDEYCNYYGKPFASKFWQEAQNTMKIDLTEFSFDNLPFCMTRQLMHNKKNIFRSLLCYYMMLHDSEMLDDQLEFLKKRGKQKKNTEIITSNQQEQDDLESYGYRKTKIIHSIKQFLNVISECKSSTDKINNMRKMFCFCESNEFKRFLQCQDMFRKTVQMKLYHLRNKDNVREAATWYRRIFDERMPIELSID